MSFILRLMILVVHLNFGFGRTVRFGRILSQYFQPNQDSVEPCYLHRIVAESFDSANLEEFEELKDSSEAKMSKAYLR